MKALVSALLALLILLTSCGKDKEKENDLRFVRYQKVRVSKGVQMRAFAGLTKPDVESKLSFRVPGSVEQLLVNVGDKVRTGDVLAKIDPTDFSLKVEEAEATLLQSKAQERHAAASYARIRELYETHSTSRNELDASRATAESASAAVDAMQKKLALTRSQLGYTVLRAPFDGNLAAVSTEVNENVVGGQLIVVLNSLSRLEVKVSIPEILITQIKKGEGVTVSFDAVPGVYFGGAVLEVGIASDVGTTFPVTVELTQSPSGIRAGMAAEVLFQFQDPEFSSGIYVPSRAVVGSDTEQHVFMLIPIDGKTGVVEKRDVVVGQLSNGGLEITSGISGGELVITAGLHSLKDGQKVRMRGE